jgi:RimJ/RimL family protein N-acetyltransferase
MRPPIWWQPLEWPPWELRLVPVRREDAKAVARVLTNEIAHKLELGTAETMRAGTPRWAEEAESLACAYETFRYLVWRAGRLAGAIELRRDASQGHVGYWLRRPARGAGTVTLANHVIILVGFEGLGLRSLDWIANAENRASISVMERVGARLLWRGSVANRPFRTFEVRYRLDRSRYRRLADGPRYLTDLIAPSE